MTMAQVKDEALKLSAEERLALAEARWESVEKDAADLPVHDWQKRLLDERLEDAGRRPDAWLTWDEVKERVLASIRRQPGA
jgi:putative addiction module component (TIGR02574 family)